MGKAALESETYWRQCLLRRIRHMPPTPQDVAQRLINRATKGRLPGVLPDYILRIAKAVEEWEDVELIGREIDQLSSYEWDALAAVLIWGAREALDTGLTYTRCKYCWRPSLNNALCHDHQPPNTENGYRRWRRLIIWASEVEPQGVGGKPDQALTCIIHEGRTERFFQRLS